MPSYFKEIETEHGIVRAFHDSAECVEGEHDWSGWQEHYNYCEHEGDDHTGCNPSGGEAICVKCGMGAMHHSLMFF